MKLWLDDTRPAPDGWTWAKTADEAVSLVNQHGKTITEVSLDHDLGATPADGIFARGSSEQDGKVVANYIAGYKQIPLDTPIRVHSWNPSGASYMAHVLVHAGYTTEVRPFHVTEFAA